MGSSGSVTSTEPRSVNAVLDAAAERWPDHDAVVTDERRLTYAELHERSCRLAGGLAAFGIEPGDRVAASLPNDVDIVVAFYATQRLGAIWVGVNRQLAAPEKAHILGDTTPRLLLAEAATLDSLTGRLDGVDVDLVAVDRGDRWSELAATSPADHRPVDPLAPAAIAFTSGTSGFPKGVVHSQHNLVLPGAAQVADRGYDPSFRRGDFLALTILNLIVLSTLTAAQAGGTSVLTDRTDPAGLAAWVRRHRVTVLNVVPTILHGLLGAEGVEPDDLASLRDLWSGGAPCPEELRQRFLDRFGKVVHATYGLTEAPSLVSIDPLDDPSPAGVSGVPLSHLDVTIAPDGEVVVGPVADGPWAGAYRPFLGYWNRPGVEVPVRDGRLHTGDVGRIDDGRVVIVDRLSSVILRGGANVYPAEVERVLRLSPEVADAVVVGIPDERLGETVQALVELEAGARVAGPELIVRCRAELARYKVPARIEVVDAIVRNAMGKPDRRAAVAALSGASGSDRPPSGG